MFSTLEKWAGRVSILGILGGALVWFISEIPKPWKPASEQYVEDRVIPVERDSKVSVYQIVVEGIAWGNRHLADPDSEHKPDYIHGQLCGNAMEGWEGYYRIFERVTGGKHHTEGARCQ